MSKRDRDPGRGARDVHQAIREDGKALRSGNRLRVRNPSEFPEVAELLEACRDAVGGNVPSSVMFKGRRYWMRVRLHLQIDVFDTPDDPRPLLSGAALSLDDFGHRPGH